MRPRLIVGAAAAAVALAGVPQVAGAGSSKSARVALKDISFTPATVHIRKGGSVTWTWKDGPYTPHNIHSVGALRFKGASDRQAGSYTVRFTKAGTYRYHCTIHPNMNGKVVVK